MVFLAVVNFPQPVHSTFPSQTTQTLFSPTSPSSSVFAVLVETPLSVADLTVDLTPSHHSSRCLIPPFLIAGHTGLHILFPLSFHLHAHCSQTLPTLPSLALPVLQPASPMPTQTLGSLNPPSAVTLSFTSSPGNVASFPSPFFWCSFVCMTYL